MNTRIFTLKISKLSELISEMKLDALILSKRWNLSWLFSGEFHVVESSEDAVATAVVTRDGGIKIYTTINEYQRILEEELSTFNVEIVSLPWHENPRDAALREIAGKTVKIGADFPHENTIPVEQSLTELRVSLLEDEITKLMELGGIVGREITRICEMVEKEMTEYDVRGLVLQRLGSYGIRVPVILVGSDERVFKYRHPIPKNKKIEKYVMIVVVAEKYGLHVALTRSIYFGKLPVELMEKQRKVAYVDTVFIANTKTGASIREVFKAGLKAYADVGYPNEWKLHHQGGWIAYKPREIIVTEDTTKIVKDNQAFAWNPTLAGTKSEDTIIVINGKPQIITLDKKWPVIEVTYNEETFLRPSILEK